MHWTRAALILCAAVAGCRFSVDGIDTNGAGGGDMDLATGGGGSVDMAGCMCATGCSTSATTCLALQPSGPVTAGDYQQANLINANVTANIVIDTDSGQITGGLIRPAGAGVLGGVGFRTTTQAGGPGAGIFSVAGLTLAAGAKVTFKGANAFALASAGNVTLDGTVDASCTANVPGPGGFAGGVQMDGKGPGAGKRGEHINGSAGGGGAGYGDGGGTGGLLATQTSNGGAIWGDLTPATFVLAGGSGGGAGGDSGGNGGSGGGAVMFAVNGVLRVGGTIHVGGCGGLHGDKDKGGGGGGSGGAIVLEASSIALTSTAVLASNGGGGAAGTDMSKSGGDALAAVTAALGGTTMAPTGGSGGNGGASNGMPGLHFTNGRDGLIPNAVTGFGGGGGGGVGRIAVRAQAGGISDSSTAVTPDAADSNKSGAHPTVYGVAKFQ
ncbi:MAG: hypothetical protein JWN44_3965 [Myxococcales bacterium]|nr:hypothetical protein [Myxococcales bacterium]